MLNQVVVIEKLQNIYTDGTIITAKWTSTGTEMEDTQYQLRLQIIVVLIL